MTNPIYALLSKQAGLRRQVDLIAHNVANLGTAGFKREGLTFAAHIERLDVPGGELALADAPTSYTDLDTGPLARTDNPLDADMEAASARLQSLAVQQQLGLQSLSIANSNPQNLLSLFR